MNWLRFPIRRVALAGMLAAALLLPAGASAKSFHLVGHVTGVPSSSIGFSIVIGSRGVFAGGHSFNGIPISCSLTGQTTAHDLVVPSRVKISRKGQWLVNSPYDDGLGHSNVITLTGHVTRHGRAFGGTLDIHGAFPNPSGVFENCFTGVLTWST